LKLYGDVEFNIDASSKKHSSTLLKTTADRNANRDKRWDINGRVLIGLVLDLLCFVLKNQST
jgi:hypothetical protein